MKHTGGWKHASVDSNLNSGSRIQAGILKRVNSRKPDAAARESLTQNLNKYSNMASRKSVHSFRHDHRSDAALTRSVLQLHPGPSPNAAPCQRQAASAGLLQHNASFGRSPAEIQD